MPLSVSRTRSFVSNGAKRIYNPHTGDGVILDQEAVPTLRIHECGSMILDADWNYRGVCSPFWRAYFNLDSGAAVQCGGKRWKLLPGTVLILPEGQLYDCIPSIGVRHLWIHFSPGFPTAPQEPTAFKLDALSEKNWRGIYQDTLSRADPYRLRFASAAAILHLLGQMNCGAQCAQSRQLQQLLAWLDTAVADRPSLDTMASRVGMGRRSFFRWFREATGSTPAAYLTRRRIREACRLLCFGNDSIEQVAEATGFANRHHFTRAFTAETGTSPAAFRRGKRSHV